MPLLARSAADRRSAPVWRGRTCADDLNDNELRYLHNADNARVAAKMRRRQHDDPSGPSCRIAKFRKSERNVLKYRVIPFYGTPGEEGMKVYPILRGNGK